MSRMSDDGEDQSLGADQIKDLVNFADCEGEFVKFWSCDSVPMRRIKLLSFTSIKFEVKQDLTSGKQAELGILKRKTVEVDIRFTENITNGEDESDEE